jgi:hypothetical protein
VSADGVASPATPAGAPQGNAFVVILLLAAVVGAAVSLAAWGFLELVHQLQVGVFTDLPKDVGYDHGAPLRRPFVLVPAAGLLVAGLAIAFTQVTDKGVDQVLFSGQDAIGPLAGDPGAWSVGALAAVIGFKGLAWGISLGSFRGGPTFPAMFLGAAAGVMASHLPGFDLTPAVAVGMGAAVVAVLRLPLSAVVLATLLTTKGGLADTPLIIVGVVVAYLVTIALSPRLEAAAPAPMEGPRPAADDTPTPAIPDATPAGVAGGA